VEVEGQDYKQGFKSGNKGKGKPRAGDYPAWMMGSSQGWWEAEPEGGRQGLSLVP
jgi:hypothetical protein